MIIIKIGQFERSYIPVLTNAPKSYDYSGVIRVNIPCFGDIALIEIEKSEHQRGRYASGLYSHDIITDIPDTEIIEAIYQKLIKG